jgi:threonine/homoserine/homoserine lactone efflux protein
LSTFLATAFGIGALVESSVAAFTTLKLGGCYLIYLGVSR